MTAGVQRERKCQPKAILSTLGLENCFLPEVSEVRKKASKPLCSAAGLKET